MIDWVSIYQAIDLPAVFMGFGNLGFIIVLAKWHVDDGEFDFRRALLDPLTDAISFTRLGQLTALVASTEVMFYLAVKDRLAEWFFLGYMGAWAGVAIYGKWQDSKNVKDGVELKPSSKPLVSDN